MADSSFDISKVIDDAISVITKPAEFYRGMNKTGGYLEPVIFVVVMAVVAAIVMMVLSFVGFGMGAMAIGFFAIILVPIFAIIGSFICAIIMFVIWKLLGTDESFETAYRCVAYAMAIFPVTAIVQTIPYIGSVVGIAWYMYLMAIASHEVHGTDQKKAYIVMGVLAVLLVLFNVSSEMKARQMQATMEQMGMTMEQMGQDPEAMGKAVGEFLKGLEEAQQQ